MTLHLPNDEDLKETPLYNEAWTVKEEYKTTLAEISKNKQLQEDLILKGDLLFQKDLRNF